MTKHHQKSGKSKTAIRALSIDDLLSIDELPATKVAEAAAKPRLKKPVSAGYIAGESTGPAVADPLPVGWVAMQDEDGDVFYYHAATAAAQWERPVASKVVAAAPAPAPAAAAKTTAATTRAVGVAATRTVATVAGKAGAAASTSNLRSTVSASSVTSAASSSFAGARAGVGAAAKSNAAAPAAATAGGLRAGGGVAKSAAAPAPAPAPAPAAAAAGGASDADKGCDDFTPNPFKPTLCKHCRKAASAH